ncbi:DUF1772 domain-containing protein [Spirosoma sp. SC4-14]|uniref:DUF1772 domain-containing protein n=1 Tax=Spirosoma sp. SC4-14 TaxID=3128900 RepID=UPI0030CC79D0
MNVFALVVLSLFILNLGIALGAGLYEAKMIMPLWFHKSAKVGYVVNSRAMDEVNAGRKFWAYVTTGPLTLLTMANLALAWQLKLPGYEWWLVAASITLIERIGTFSFFIPTAIKLQMSDQLASERVNRLVALWIGLNYVRNICTLLSFAAALVAFTFIA